MEKIRNAALLVIVVLCLPLILAWVAVYLVFMAAWGVSLRIWFWRAHASHGRFILYVYSKSPNWQSYVEAHILPRIADRAVVLNWSERRQWSSSRPWEERFFRRFAGDREFIPIALVFGSRGRITAVPFYRAFLDYKHGRSAALERVEAQLYELAKVAT
jgi:hypothetical protein